MAQIRLQLRPAGASCNHVHINDVDGNRLRVVTIAELRAAVRLKEDFLIAQIKRIARDSGLTDPALLKAHLETKEFDLD